VDDVNKILTVLIATAALVAVATVLIRKGVGSGGTVDAGSFIT
jgi:hypothetical protein